MNTRSYTSYRSMHKHMKRVTELLVSINVLSFFSRVKGQTNTTNIYIYVPFMFWEVYTRSYFVFLRQH